MSQPNIFFPITERGANYPRKLDVFFCCLIMFSFCYELPLIKLTSYDRLNPRLFDVVVLAALLFTKWTRRGENPIIISWQRLTIVFLCAGLISIVFILPGDMKPFSLYFCLKYIEGLIALWILTGFLWERKQIELLLKVFLVGVLLAGIVGFLQLLGIVQLDRVLPTGEPIPIRIGIVLSTLGVTYFHSGIIGAMGATISLALRLNKAIRLIPFIVTFSAGAFLSLFSGSRSALGVLCIASVILLTLRIKYLLVFIAVVAILFAQPSVRNMFELQSATIQRFNELTQEDENSITGRTQTISTSIIGDYWKQHGFPLLLWGGGFYCVPMDDFYRVGYGIHNIHLFPLEQAGVAGFIFAILFWVTVIRQGIKRKNDIYGRCGLAFGIAFITIGWFGAIFYYGFGTENMVICQVSIMALLLQLTIAKVSTTQ